MGFFSRSKRLSFAFGTNFCRLLARFPVMLHSNLLQNCPCRFNGSHCCYCCFRFRHFSNTFSVVCSYDQNRQSRCTIFLFFFLIAIFVYLLQNIIFICFSGHDPHVQWLLLNTIKKNWFKMFVPTKCNL